MIKPNLLSISFKHSRIASRVFCCSNIVRNFQSVNLFPSVIVLPNCGRNFSLLPITARNFSTYYYKGRDSILKVRGYYEIHPFYNLSLFAPKKRLQLLHNVHALVRPPSRFYFPFSYTNLA